MYSFGPKAVMDRPRMNLLAAVAGVLTTVNIPAATSISANERFGGCCHSFYLFFLVQFNKFI